VVIASSTQRLIGGLFEYRDLGAVTLKGFAKPVQVWQVLGTGVAAAAGMGVAVVGMAAAGVVGNFWIKSWPPQKSVSSIVGKSPSAPGHRSPSEEFTYLTKQMGPHGAAPKFGDFNAHR
jgi:hypothetical protein